MAGGVRLALQDALSEIQAFFKRTGRMIRPITVADTRVVYCGDNLEQLRRLVWNNTDGHRRANNTPSPFGYSPFAGGELMWERLRRLKLHPLPLDGVLALCRGRAYARGAGAGGSLWRSIIRWMR